ncbi:MAG: hypothetical protein EA401_09270 [Planctomycetota bacterium]|nr:MAG: hypothetical protein EA401_09270 [Planctomycetota bacterium]
MKKLVRAQQEGVVVLRERTGRTIIWSVEGLHDDFRILARFPDLDRQEVPLVLGFLASGLQSRIHPRISIEEAPQ